MKYHICALALVGTALLPLTSVRADDKKAAPLSVPLSGSAPFSSPAVPLSRAETQQLALLTREDRKAEAEMTAAFDRQSTLQSAVLGASPANTPGLERKIVMAATASLRAVQNKFATETALASFQSVTRLPVEVRPYLPAGARSLYLGLQPTNASGEKMLFHLWTAPRRAGSAPYHPDFDPSPFCLDVFTKGKANDEMPGKWNFVTTTSFLAENIPDASKMKMHFLNATSQQGPVVSFESSQASTGRPPTLIFTVITFPKGLVKDPADETEEPLSFVQNLYGGGKTRTYYDFGVDEHGSLTLLEKEVVGEYRADLSEGPGKVVGTLKWNGQKYVPSPAE